MSALTGGFSFVIEFAQSGVNKVVQALFDYPDEGVPTKFHHDQPGQSGLVSSRQTFEGNAAYKRYLLEGLVGYDLGLYDPRVRLLAGDRQAIELSFGFDLSILRQFLVRRSEDSLHIPPDPESVDPDVDYEEVYNTGLLPIDLPEVQGRLVITLSLNALPFGPGNRISINASESSLDLVERIDIVGVDWPPRLEDFVETIAAKAISYILSEEVKEIDLTPQFGVFNNYGLTLRPPLHFRVGQAEAQPSLAIGMHEWSLIDDGNIRNVDQQVGDRDYAVQIDEAFFSLLLAQLQNAGIVARRYDLSGGAADEGPILLHDIRIVFEPGRIRFNLLVDFNGFVSLFAETFVAFETRGDGSISVSLEDTRIHVQLHGVLGAIQKLFNTLTFHIVDELFSNVLGDILEAVVEKPIGGSLDEFLKEGAIGFGFRSPIRNTGRLAVLKFTDFNIATGRLLLRGDLEIEES